MSAPVDLSYTEPNGWTSVPSHCADQAEAERLRDATNFLSGPDAQHRRRWLLAPCTCPAGAR